MKKILIVIILSILTLSCTVSQVSVSSIGTTPQYYNRNPNFKVHIIDTEYKLNMLLVNDFNFRYDYAHYMMRQPRHPNWNRNVLNNRYSYYNPYLGYSPNWDRNQMWNDWIWGFPYDYGRRWGHSWNSYYGWNNHYGWNNYYGRYNWGTWNRHLNPNQGRPKTNTLRGRYITTEVIHGNNNTRRRVYRAPKNTSTRPTIRNSNRNANNVNSSQPRRVNTRVPVRTSRSRTNTQNTPKKRNNTRKNQ